MVSTSFCASIRTASARSGLAPAVLLLGTLAPVLAAQSAGALVGTPATVFVGTGTTSSGGALATDQVHRKTAGFLPFGATDVADQWGDPVFTTSAMFGGGVAPPDFEVDAMSLGLDVVPAEMTDLGVAYVNFGAVGGWGELLYSVSPGTNGTPGGLVEQEKAAPGGAAADLFTLMLPGSEEGLPADVLESYPVDVPQRALDATEMELSGGASGPDITSADLTMQLYQAAAPGKPADASPVLFFSVSHDSVFPPGGGPSKVPATWFDCGLPSGATILKTRWIPDLAPPLGGHWTEPRVHLSYDHLGLDPEADIDALAVDRAQSLVLFSIKRTPTSTLDQQLQVASWPAGTTTCAGMAGMVKVGIYMVPAGSSADGAAAAAVAARLAIGPAGDVDSVCVVDPGTQGGGLSLAFGTPAAHGLYYNDLACGVYRDDDNPLGGPTITLTVAGLPVFAPDHLVEAYALVPGFGLLQVVSLPIEPLLGSSTFELPITLPDLGILQNTLVQVIWVVRQSGVPSSKVSSPWVAISL